MDGLNFGLNSRDADEGMGPKKGRQRQTKKMKGLSGFGGGSDDEDDSPSDARSAVNREIAAEQAALRKRAAAAISSAEGTTSSAALYDYDNEFDSFASGGAAAAEKEERRRADDRVGRAMSGEKKAESKYVSGLLKTSQRRNRERELVFERKVLKDQAEEDAELRYDGKEKFVTKAYKRKLAEREEWAKEEEDLARLEDEEDVTKTKKGGNFLYGGFNRNIVMGGGGNDETTNKTVNEKGHDDQDEGHARDGFVDGFSREVENLDTKKDLRDARCDAHVRNDGGPTGGTISQQPIGTDSEGDAKPKVKTRKEILAERAIKLRDARSRYFERIGTTARQ